MYSSVYLLIPYSSFIPSLLPFFPWNHKFVFYVCESVSVLYMDSFVLFFWIPHKSDIIYSKSPTCKQVLFQFVHKSNKVNLGPQLTQLAIHYCTVIGL